ncbi:DegT/DnrJ/EryC1/StrS family aminotransferase [uncultured Ilyobacter sp.]|uniref:DegT/DnrJ/EryC1/StrS family aminotransferase n=1 Tax=uncultured Ilyobacter sp. TaxID=544433 RepID=UPI0029C07D40|nr:DegT/DnrJ/EryC1/StrS family aminotransferase [uncultured Ilyobacter sp.]
MKKIPLMNLKDCFADIYDEVMDKMKELVDNTRFIGGAEIELFEKEFAQYCHTEYAVGCSNGTDAIEIALRTLGVGHGDIVLVPANSFIATAEAVINVDADVEFIDVEDEYYTIDVEKLKIYLEENKEKNIKAIIPVHLYGQMADMPEIMKIAEEYGLKVIEDSAQAHGAEINGKRPGEYGDFATFSFYPGKNLGAFGDAGALVTNYKELYEKARMLVNHGRKPGVKYEHEIVGYNKRIDTLQAAVLRIKLKHLEKWTDMRREKVKYYLELLKNNNNIILPKLRRNSNPVWHLFVIRVDDRNNLQKKLQENGISSGIHYPIALHMQPAYRYKGYVKGDFPVAEKHAKEILSLPLWPEIEKSSIKEICDRL